MLAEILNVNVFAFLLIFVRVGTAFFILPGFGSLQVNARARLSLALAVTFVLTPVLVPQMPAMPSAPLALFLLMAGEFIAGIILGVVPLILVSALQTAGTVISFVSAMANSLILDPISQQQSAIVAGFLTTTATLLLFVTNMHHVFIQAMLDSYSLFRPGVAPDIGDSLHLIARTVADSFKLGVQLASPFLVVSFAYYLVLGILTRLSPQIPIFFVAMPFQIEISLVLLMLTVPAILLVFFDRLREGLAPFLAL